MEKRTSQPGFVRPVSGRSALRYEPRMGPRTGQQMSLAELADAQQLAADRTTVPFSVMPYTGPKTGDRLNPLEMLMALEDPHRTGRHAGHETLLRKHGRRMAAFSVVGAAVFALGVVVQWALVRAGAGSYGSYAGQAVVSIEVSWLLNRRFTWADRDVSGGTSLLKWNIQRWAATVPNLALYAVLIWAGTGWLVANVATTAVFTAVNYVLGDRWSFTRSQRSRGLLLPAPAAASVAGTGVSAQTYPWRGSEVPVGVPALPLGPLPTVSIVIPCKGSERTIRATVDSLLGQDYPAPVEVILVGDVGDSTWSALADIADPRLVLLEQPRVLGKRDPNVKRHSGLMRARGDLLALADSDIVMDPDWLSTGVALLLQQGGGLVAGGMRAIQPHKFWPRFVDRNSLAAKTSRIPHPYRVTAADFGKRKAPLTANVIFSRDLYQQTPLDAAWAYGYEDYEWMWRVVRDGHKVLMHAALNGAHYHREKFGQLIKEYRRSAQGCAQFVRRHPDSPLARKRRVQAAVLPLLAAASAAAASIALATGRGLVLASLIVAAIIALALLEGIRSRSMEAVGYPAAALALGGVFTATLARNLVMPPGERAAPTWDTEVRGRHPRVPWVLAAILGAQSALSLGLVWSNTVFADEALYLWAGHLEIAHWLHGYPLPTNQQPFAAYFSGAPQIYPPIGAMADALGGIAGARILGLVFMLTATVFLYLSANRLLGRQAALAGAAVWAVCEPCIRLAFATYDPMTVMLLAFATWLAIESAHRKHHGEIVGLSALVLALGCVVTYSYVLYIPVIIVVAWLAWREPLGERRAAVSAAWLGSVSIVLFAGVMSTLHDWGGFVNEILTHSGNTSGVESVARSAWEWGAVIAALAVVGCLSAAASGNRRLAMLLVTVTLSTILVPLNQARIETGTSLDKHMAVGLWLAAIAAGYGIASFRLPALNRFQAAALACAALSVPAIAGWTQAYGTYHIWPSTAEFAPAFDAAVKASPGTVLVEDPATGLRNVAEYSSSLGHDWRAWGDVSWDPVFEPVSEWESYYAGQIEAQRFSVIALFFPLSKDALTSSVARQLLSGTAQRQKLLNIVTYDPQVPGMYSLAQAITANPGYEITDIIPCSGTTSGDYVIWHYVEPKPAHAVKKETRHHRRRK